MIERDTYEPEQPREQADKILEEKIESLIRNANELTEQELLERTALDHEADTEESPHNIYPRIT